MTDLEFAKRLYNGYEDYLERSLINRRFKHSDIFTLISKIKNKDKFRVKKAGSSSQGRETYLISYGKGKTRIFLWSQMHGDEATATMAIFDVLNFLSAGNGYEEIRKELEQKLTIYFMPMVNPDGAELFQRRNIFGIDINRDALRLQSYEAKLLMKTLKKLKANFGFNLHDQSTRYSAGKSFKPATLSFLSPPADEKRKMTAARNDAARLIARLFRLLSHFIPGHIAKYSDEFEPRAFGDNFQKLGTSTILIESGGWKNDPEKQFIRKLNFIALLCAFKSIAEKNYKKEKFQTYDAIPPNEELLKDIIFRNLVYSVDGKKCLVDIAVTLNEINTKDAKNFYCKSVIDDIGDLSTLYGYEDHDFKGFTVEYGKTYREKMFTVKELPNLDFTELYINGFTNIIVRNCENMEFSKFPVNIVKKDFDETSANIKIDSPANLIFRKNNDVKYVLVNGFLFNIKNSFGEIKNGIIL